MEMKAFLGLGLGLGKSTVLPVRMVPLPLPPGPSGRSSRPLNTIWNKYTMFCLCDKTPDGTSKKVYL